METTGLEGHTTTRSPPSRRLEHTGSGAGRRRPLEPDRGHGDVVAKVVRSTPGSRAPRPRPAAARVRSGSSVTGSMRDAHPEGVGQLAGDLAQGGALVQALGPVAVGGQVLIAEVEPGDPPKRSSDSMTRQVSPARPQPVSGLMASASVYSTVSRSGEMCSPWSTVSSPVLTMAVISPGGSTSIMPRSSRAAPTPPASAVITGVR